jgi:predicted transcriptional regulator
MARVALTLRIDSEERAALESLSKLEGRPVNQLLNEAIQGYLRKQGAREQSLDESLGRLRAYREKDPGYKQAIADFVEAEASMEDPLDGEWSEQATDQGPVQSKIRELLGGS